MLHEGGIVPKSLYKSLSDDEGNGSPTHDGHHIYQSVDLKPGQVHEVLIRNNDPHSILTWDFDVLRSNLQFTVYRTSKSLPNNSGEYNTCVFHFETIAFWPNTIYWIKFTDKQRSLFDSEEFELEKNYYRVEPTLDCRQKESVQVKIETLIFVIILLYNIRTLIVFSIYRALTSWHTMVVMCFNGYVPWNVIYQRNWCFSSKYLAQRITKDRCRIYSLESQQWA